MLPYDHKWGVILPCKNIGRSFVHLCKNKQEGLFLGGGRWYCPTIYKMVCVPNEDLDQTAQTHSLIRVFDGHSMGSQGLNLSSGRKLRLWSYYGCADWFQSPLYSHADLVLMLDTSFGYECYDWLLIVSRWYWVLGGYIIYSNILE